MNYGAIIYYAGMVLKLEALFMLPPWFLSLYDGDHDAAKGFFVAALISLVMGGICDLVKRNRVRPVYIKDSLVLVAVCWILMSAFGALPFYLGGAIHSPVDSLFESVSGFTTTGATILTDVEALPRSFLFWRSFSHWIGGMGVLVFLLAISSSSHGGEYSVNVMKAESPGPAPGKLVPRLRQSSIILYGIYFVLTFVQILLLLAGRMPLFDSICNAMATTGTGGFGINNASIAAYNSLYLEVVITVFMILCGVNFNIYYFVLTRNGKGILRSEELWTYLGIFVGATALISLNLFFTGVYEGADEAARYASFQVGSVMTTTGFSTADFNQWPEFSRILLLLVMVIGASAGSTGGGLKVSRILILCKEAKRVLIRVVHPRSVGIVKVDGKSVDDKVVHSVNNYFFAYCLLTIGSFLLLSLDNFDFETTVTSVLTCMGNVGPGLGKVSPAGNFSEFSALSKLVLILDMLIGRLEIYPILVLFAPRTWRAI